MTIAEQIPEAKPPVVEYDFVRYGGWSRIDLCRHCKQALTAYEMRSGHEKDACPYCGFQSGYGLTGTVFDSYYPLATIARAERTVYYYKRRRWWFPLLVKWETQVRGPGEA